MADYWGLREIADRMGWGCINTPVRQAKKYGFPMFTRRRGRHPRRIYYTNDALINTWEWTMCKFECQRLVEKERMKIKAHPEAKGKDGE